MFRSSERRHPEPGPRRGFTLVELVTSVTIMTILMASMGSAIMIAGRAIDDGTGPAARTAAARGAVDRIMADINVALISYERSPTAIGFTVPDRNGDGMPDTIRYAWTGNPGAPLTMEYNGGSAVPIAEDVHRFDLTYLSLAKGPPPPPPEQESAEMLLASHDDAAGGTIETAEIKDFNWAAQYFLPSFPNNVTSWKITRVKFVARTNGPVAGDNSVEIRPAGANEKPTDTVLEFVIVPESALSGSPAWVDVTFSSLSGLDPSTGSCLLIRGLGNQFTATISFERDGSPMTPGAHFISSFDQGASWTAPEDTLDMLFYVYGTVTTEGAPEWP